MAKGINQKGKLLYLEKILKETSETHPCTMQEIIGRLQEYGVSAERKSIYDDMEVLRSFGMDIKFKRGKFTGYYITGQSVDQRENVDIPGSNTGFAEGTAGTPAGSVPAQNSGQEDNVQAKQKKLSWLLSPSDSEEDKPVKLLCSNKKKNDIIAALGNYAQYKEKEDDCFVASVQVDENPEFYGWLTQMGRDVVILKPKKSVQAYREYLKNILKQYK